jgi:hypothetical protein
MGKFVVVDSTGASKQASVSSGSPDVTSATGTLAIGHGGTGATTLAAAQTALGIQTDAQVATRAILGI